jgi:hypothetical protein
MPTLYPIFGDLALDSSKIITIFLNTSKMDKQRQTATIENYDMKDATREQRVKKGQVKRVEYRKCGPQANFASTANISTIRPVMTCASLCA